MRNQRNFQHVPKKKCNLNFVIRYRKFGRSFGPNSYSFDAICNAQLCSVKPLSCILPSRITFDYGESFSSTSRLLVISDSSGTTLISEFTCVLNAAALFSEIELPYYSSVMKGSKYWLWLSLESYLNMTTLADNCFNCKRTNFSEQRNFSSLISQIMLLRNPAISFITYCFNCII